jgi:kynurenine formamidase
LTGLGELLGKEAFFIFAPIKLRGAHGGYGRAIALY